MQLIDGPPAAIAALAFSPDGAKLAVGGKNASLAIHDLASGEPPEIVGSGGHVTAVAFAPNGSRLVYGTPAGWTAVFPADAVKSNSPTASLVFLDEHTLCVGVGDRAFNKPGGLELWDMKAGKRKVPVFQEPAGVRGIDVHAATRRVAWANGSKLVFVWDVLKADPVRFPQTHASNAVAFHPDGLSLAATLDRSVRVYDLARRQEKFTLKGHAGQVTGVAFSPDGRTLASGSWDGTVRFWDAATGRETSVFQWPVGRVTCLAFAPDGLRLAAAGDKGTVAVVDTE